MENRNTDEKNGFCAYMTVEGSFVFPLLIMLYFLLIMTALLLLARCLTSQNDYILGLRGARFTDGAEDYGEVLYGAESRFLVEAYLRPRLTAVGRIYSAFPQQSAMYERADGYAVIRTAAGGKIGQNRCEKRVRIIDPIAYVR